MKPKQRAIRAGLSIFLIALVIGVGIYIAQTVNSPLCYEGFCQGDNVSAGVPIIYPIGTLSGTPDTILHPDRYMNSTDAIAIELTIKSPAPIVEGAEVNVSAIATTSPQMLKNLSVVSVAWQSASPYRIGVGLEGSGFSIGNGYGVALYPNSSQYALVNPSLGAYLTGPKAELTFLNAGVYSPVLTIVFNNGSKPIQQTYQGIALNVLAPAVLESQRFNVINLALAYALVVFGFIEAVKTAVDLNQGHEVVYTPLPSEANVSPGTPADESKPPRKKKDSTG